MEGARGSQGSHLITIQVWPRVKEKEGRVGVSMLSKAFREFLISSKMIIRRALCLLGMDLPEYPSPALPLAGISL